MDIYYNKYLKYKTKYLDLKKQIEKQSDENDTYISELQKKYPTCVHDTTKLKDETKYLADGHATTYGEMEYEAIEMLNNKFGSGLDSKTGIKYFIDFGSGRGKLPLFMGDKVSKSIGIELVTERHNDAVKLKEELSKKFPKVTSKVELINEDIFEYLKTINKSTFDSPVLIWISNLCFPESLTKKLFDLLVEKMPSGSIIGSSKIPEAIPEGIEPVITNGKSENKLTVPMSWTTNSTIYIYKIK
jgi:hypothetical protein